MTIWSFAVGAEKLAVLECQTNQFGRPRRMVPKIAAVAAALACLSVAVVTVIAVVAVVADTVYTVSSSTHV
jgi:hypothetical protein